jgi:hypothetical protein
MGQPAGPAQPPAHPVEDRPWHRCHPAGIQGHLAHDRLQARSTTGLPGSHPGPTGRLPGPLTATRPTRPPQPTPPPPPRGLPPRRPRGNGPPARPRAAAPAGPLAPRGLRPVRRPVRLRPLPVAGPDRPGHRPGSSVPRPVGRPGNRLGSFSGRFLCDLHTVFSPTVIFSPML